MSGVVFHMVCDTCEAAHPKGPCRVWACNWHRELRFDRSSVYMRHMDDSHPHWRDDEFLTEACSGCGISSLVGRDTAPLRGDRCMHCPPIACSDCGEPDDRSCSCWVSIESLNHADLKALFAADGTFNVNTDGSVSLS